MKSFEDNRVEIVRGDRRDQTINTHTHTLNQSQLPDQSQTIEKEKKSS